MNMIQSLEARRLLASVTAAVVNGKLTVTGTSAADTIDIEANPFAEINVGGVDVFSGYADEGGTLIGTFGYDEFSSLLVDAKGGSDRVKIGFEVNLENGTGTKVYPATLLGGTGNDTIDDQRFTSGPTKIDGGADNDTLSGSDSIFGGTGNDTIAGQVFDNHGTGPAFGEGTYFDGGDGDDTINAFNTAIKIFGGSGKDKITSENSTATIDAGSGDDTVTVSGKSTTHLGTGRDSFTALERRTLAAPIGPIIAYGDDDDDTMFLSTPPFLTPFENATVVFHDGNGNDTINAAGAYQVETTFYGDVGNDTITGSGDGDTVYGGDGNDVVSETYGNNEVHGDAGDDNITGGIQNDRLYGGSGRDSLDGNNGNDLIYGDSGDDKLFGRAGNDTLYGGDNNDILDGGIHNDSLFGDAGNDDLFGSDGNDTLTGGSGNNRLFGQKGIDTIRSKNGVVDQIFASTDGDVLDRD